MGFGNRGKEMYMHSHDRRCPVEDMFARDGKIGGNKINKLDSITFETFADKVDPFGKNQDVLDLRDFGFVSPSALVQVVATCYAVKASGRSPRIILEEGIVSSYLCRAGFISVLRSIAEFQPRHLVDVGYEHLRGSSPFLIEVTKIECGADLPEILNQIIDVLRNKFKYKKFEAFDIATVVSEICQNTFDHNKSTCGFLAMQVYGTGTRRFLEIGLADTGSGLAATLKRNPKNRGINSDLDAIKLSVQPGTSEHDDPTRGTGLYHLLKMAYEYDGTVHIRSGRGKLRYRMDLQQGWSQEVVFIPGVHISLSLRHKKSIDKLK